MGRVFPRRWQGLRGSHGRHGLRPLPPVPGRHRPNEAPGAGCLPVQHQLVTGSPAGRGKPNEAGLDFYDRLVDGLLKAGIQPACTLFHWDFPQALFEQGAPKGGWLNRDAPKWFADYTDLVSRRYGDRIKTWMTHNEPQVFLGLGHLYGVHAPGLKLEFKDYLTATHNALRAHGHGTRVLRANVPNCRVGFVSAGQIKMPLTSSAADVAAAKKAIFAVRKKSSWNNSWFLDPVILGHYPEDGLKAYAEDMPAFPDADMKEIHEKPDFLGLNIYTGSYVKSAPDGWDKVKHPVGQPRSAVEWQPLKPDALYWGPRYHHERYGLPIFITESGLSTRDHVYLDGKVHDAKRIDYLHRVFLNLKQAINDGVDIRGYYAWSLLDNFEWADGYKQRFGLIYVDYATGKRLPKDSYHWYRRVIASRGRNLQFGRHKTPNNLTIP